MSNILIERDVPIPMRDGVRLMADVMRPDDDGQHPVILERHIYDKSSRGGGWLDCLAFVRAGYVFVRQDCRGTYASEGQWEFFYQEQDDGYDSIEWAATQPWSNGRVGLEGASGVAMTAYQTVASQPPSLKAAFIGVGAADMQSWVRRGGVFSEYALGQGYLAALIVAQNLARLDIDEDERARLQASVSEAWIVTMQDMMRLPLLDYEALKDERLTAGWRDVLLSEPTDPFWKKEETTLGMSPERAKAPIKSIAAFYDPFLASMVKAFAGAPPELGHELIIGPWAHFGVYHNPYGGKTYKAAPAGPTIWTTSAIEWFDRWMKDDDERSSSATLLDRMMARGAPADDGDQPGASSSEVFYFQAGENYWATSPTWPPVGEERTVFLSSESNTVLLDAPTRSGSRAFSYDPRDPVPTIGGTAIDSTMTQVLAFDDAQTVDGVQDQRRIEDRADVLVYESAELEEVVRVAGPVTADLWVSSSAEDTDFFVRLIDVEPNGFAGNVTEGAIRARYREGRNDSWLTPGECVQLRVVLDDTAHSFLPGHRIRVDVTSSCFPKYSRNLNSRVVPEFGHDADIVVAEQKVFDGPDTPSHLTLHVVAESEPTSPYA